MGLGVSVEVIVTVGEVWKLGVAVTVGIKVTIGIIFVFADFLSTEEILNLVPKK
jgi:hypothetical protein